VTLTAKQINLIDTLLANAEDNALDGNDTNKLKIIHSIYAMFDALEIDELKSTK
jgi:hypothetical protein